MHNISQNMNKSDFRLCKNAGADQLYSNCTADQRLCFHYMDSTMSLLPKYEIPTFLLSSVSAQTCLCWTWSEIPKTVFFVSRFKFYNLVFFYVTQSNTNSWFAPLVEVVEKKWAAFASRQSCLKLPLDHTIAKQLQNLDQL